MAEPVELARAAAEARPPAQAQAIAAGAPALPGQAPSPQARTGPEAVPHARPVYGEKVIAGVLRTGGYVGGACFAATLLLELVSPTARMAVLIDLLQKLGASLLIATPIIRLSVSAVLLGMKGEYRYLGYGAGILALLGIALGAGLAT